MLVNREFFLNLWRDSSQIIIPKIKLGKYADSGSQEAFQDYNYLGFQDSPKWIDLSHAHVR